MLFNPFHSVIGLDIGNETIKAVLLSIHRNNLFKTKIVLESCAEQNIPSGSMIDGEILKPEAILQVVKEVTKRVMGKQNIPWVICALPETKTFIKLLSIPLNSETLTATQIIELAQNEIPIPLNESYIDWQFTPHIQDESNSNIVLGAVLKKTADAYTYLLNIAGLTPLSLEVEAMSIVRALTNSNLTGHHLILDIGQTSTTFIIYSNNAIQFTLSFNFSGNLLTTRIQQSLSCTQDEAERIKITCGLDYEHCICHRKGKTEQCSIKPIMEQSMEELATQVQSGLDFLAEHFNSSKPIDTIILSGGGGQMLFLDKELEKRVSIKVVRGNPLSHISLGKQLIKEQTRPFMRFTTSIGLGLRALNFPFIQ